MSVAEPADQSTADSFANSWNNLSQGSVYTFAQFLDWMDPLTPESFAGSEVLELGFGNGSLLFHVGGCRPKRLVGIDLGDTIDTARKNLSKFDPLPIELHRGDLTQAQLGEFDLVYCIGVLHHLSEPRAGFESVLRHTRPGGRFHCWVYGWEGNALIRLLVEPIRRRACKLPWWINKYLVALPLSIPFFLYCKAIGWLNRLAPIRGLLKLLPLRDYAVWISKREWGFFHHVAFDQLVTPQTVYLRREELADWLNDPRIQQGSTYIQMRNGNSWKFGGLRSYE
ncbi:class I SAM-dependent methyltransferase [bacterium]|nr:class I SAM-dependent methyltransferase [bacterium]